MVEFLDFRLHLAIWGAGPLKSFMVYLERYLVVTMFQGFTFGMYLDLTFLCMMSLYKSLSIDKSTSVSVIRQGTIFQGFTNAMVVTFWIMLAQPSKAGKAHLHRILFRFPHTPVKA